MRPKHKNCIICLNGDFQKKLISGILLQNAPRDSFTIIAADGSSHTLKKYNIIPDIIIGDIDSTSSVTLKFFKNRGTKIIRIKEQEHNDFEKALKYTLKLGFKNCIVVGFGGKRSDHTINNYSILKKYSSKINIKLLDNDFEIFFIPKSIEFDYKTGEELSLITLSNARGINTSGLKYKLNNGELKFGYREGALNEASKKRVKISYKSGSVLIFKKHFDKLNFSHLFL